MARRESDLNEQERGAHMDRPKDTPLPLPENSYPLFRRKPVVLVASVFVLTFAAEVAIMAGMERFYGFSNLALWNLLDSAFLGLILLPAYYFLLFRPMSEHVKRLSAAEDELRDNQGKLETLVAKRTSELLKANEELELRYREATVAREESHFHTVLLDAVQEVIVATDLGGRLVYWNRFAGELFGFGAESLGRPVTGVGPGGADLCGDDEVRAAILEGRGLSGETQVTGRDGRSFPALTVCSPVRSTAGDLVGTIAVSSDLTRQKRTEEALRASEYLYSTVVESSLTGIFIAVDGRFVFVNQNFAQLLGYDRAQLIGMDVLRVAHPEDRSKLKATLRGNGGERDAPERIESRCVTRDGRTIWVASRNAPIRYRDKDAVLGNVIDVGDQKRAEAELKESEARLRSLSLQLIQVQEAERARIARDLHDGIGQTLTAVKFLVENGLERLRAGDSPERALGTVVPRIRAAVEEVRQISMDLRPSTLDSLGLLPTIAWFCREFQEAFPAIEVEREVGAEEDDIPDPLKITLYRLVQEAMNNVGKHSDAQRAWIRLAASEQGLRLSIEDDGSGGLLVPTGDRPGFGLKSMQQRAELTGGVFSLDRSDTGFRVSAFWPAEALQRLRG